MTFNSVTAVILRYSTEFDSFGASYVKVAKDGSCTIYDKM